MAQHFSDPTNIKAVSTRYNTLYTSHADSPTQRAIFRKVYGADYPEGVVSNSYITLTLLRRIAQEIAVGPDGTIIDLGRGRGGPGLWVARETAASLVGIDLSNVAVDHASQRAQSSAWKAEHDSRLAI